MKLTETIEKPTELKGFRLLRNFSTKELALISVLSSLWIVSEIYLGPVISQVTQVHGVVQRVFGWFLMLILAGLTRRFGRVTVMSAIASSATRIIRPGPVYSLFVGFGYALGGLTFDLLYFLPVTRKFGGKTEKAYLAGISVFSGFIALIPYLLFQLSVLGFYSFLMWFPLYTYNMVKSVVLSLLGTLIGVSIQPKIEIWAPRISERSIETTNSAEGQRPLATEQEIVKVNLREGSAEHVKDEIAVEDQIELYVNDRLYAVFSCSPFQIKELVVGHLLSEGIIGKAQEIKNIEISRGRVHVRLTKKIDGSIFSGSPFRVLASCSGKGLIPPNLWMKAKMASKNSSFKLSAEALLKGLEKLNSEAHVFRKTGGTHASALLNEEGEVLAFSEDVGRHNAVDKVIGKAALEGIDFAKTLLASTGRLSSEMVIKAAHVGVPLIISLSAPTDKGIKIAEMSGITLIGFARGRRFNIYTHAGSRIDVK
ncbi:MAG: formate dehydrogenase accessory sulfurtransferase FdhD [Candidatus Bathyarchaeia archaeon]